jgi:plastocyanin
MKHAVGSIALAALLLAGCSAHGSSASPVVPAPAQPNVINLGVVDDGVIDTVTVDKVGIRLNGETPLMSKRYGRVLGYFKGKTSTLSEIVSLPSSTEVRFFNVDPSFEHTASFLGDATQNGAPWPSSFNGSSTKSPAGTAIGTTNWSTGALLAGGHSVLYNTGMPGFYMIGCAFHYNLDGMRTVIIVK